MEESDDMHLMMIECFARRGLAIAILICYAYQVRYFSATRIRFGTFLRLITK
jgi:hypothetical protein